MNRPEAAELLTILAACDRRTIGTADVEVWANLLPDVRLVDAVEATYAHYRNSSEWLDPHRLRDLVRVLRAGRLEHHEVPCPPYELADDPIGAIEWQRDWLRRIADGETPAQIDASGAARWPMPALENVFPRIPKAAPAVPRLACPSCKAKPGVACECDLGAA